MKPELSRRLARVVNSPSFKEKGLIFKERFIERVAKAQEFEDLIPEDKEVVKLAEKSIKDTE